MEIKYLLTQTAAKRQASQTKHKREKRKISRFEDMTEDMDNSDKVLNLKINK